MILTSILMITDENCSDLHLLLWSFLSLSLFFINIFTLNILRRTSTWQRTSSQSCGGSSVLLSASSTAPRYEEPLDLEQLNVQIFQHQWMPEEVEETWMHAVEMFFLKKVLEYQVDHLLGGERSWEVFVCFCAHHQPCVDQSSSDVADFATFSFSSSCPTLSALFLTLGGNIGLGRKRWPWKILPLLTVNLDVFRKGGFCENFANKRGYHYVIFGKPI